MSESAISVRGLRKSYGTKSVLSDVSFEIPSGQTLAFLGRNGAGKTTCIQILMGLLSPDAGSVTIAGCDPVKDPIELRRRVGYLAEDQVMYPWMKPVELCRFLQPFYPTWEEKLANEYLDMFELPRQTRIGRLSKGQSVKLGLAVALAHRPKVAIFDDPALGLDPIARREFNRHLIEHLQAEGRTVLYSSHLLAEVEAVADTVAILEHIEEIPEPAGLLDIRRHDDRMAAIVDRSAAFIEQLSSHGIDAEVLDLSLDEIFEAFVVGRSKGWPKQGVAVPAN